MNARKHSYVQETARPGLNGAGAPAREACSGPSEPGRTGPGAPRGWRRSHLIWRHWGTQRLLSRRVPDHSGRSGAATVEGKDAGGRVPLEAAARVQAKPQEPELGLGTKTSLVNTARERSLHLTY